MYKKLLSTILIASSLASCAGTVARPTLEKDRDLTGKYDGTWRVTVAKGTPLQNVQNWQLNCGDMSNEFDINVRESAITVNSGVAEKTTFVSNAGKFKLYLPINGIASETAISDSTLDNGKQQIVLRGQLSDDKSVGYFTWGIADFGYAGCTSKTTFERIPDGSEI